MANVLKHARASTVRVDLLGNTRTLLVRVSDDGIGLPDAVPGSSGLGLTSMRERATELGGGFTITANRGGGTIIEAWLPMGTARKEVGR